MKKLSIFTLGAIILSLSSCQVVEGIFKAGVGVGVIMVLAVIGIIIFIVAKVAGK